MVGGGGGSRFNIKYLHSTIYVEVSLLNINGTMWVLNVNPTPTNRPRAQCVFPPLPIFVAL